MPLAKINVLEGQYDEARMNGVSAAILEALINILKVPPYDFYQIIHVLPRSRFRHTSSFLGLKYHRCKFAFIDVHLQISLDLTII